MEWQERFGFCRVRMLHFQNVKQFLASAVWDVAVSWRKKLGISGTEGDFGYLALLLSPRCQTLDFAPCDFDTFGATLGNLGRGYLEQLFRGPEQDGNSTLRTDRCRPI